MRLLATLLLLAVTAAAPAGERRFMIAGFERLRVDGPFTVEVVRGNSPQAVAEGDPAALDRLAVRVDGSTLVVSNGALGPGPRRGQGMTPPTVRIIAPRLRGVLVNGGGRVRISGMRGSRIDVAVNGAGTLDVTGVEAEDLNAQLTGTGAISVAGTARRARVRSNGAGSFDGGALAAGDAILVAESAGNTRLGVRYTARIMALGAGSVQIVGAPECTITGPGPVECEGRPVRR